MEGRHPHLFSCLSPGRATWSIMAIRLTGPMALSNDDPRGLKWFLAKDRDDQRQLVREPWRFPVAAMHLAAVTIQRFRRANAGGAAQRASEGRSRASAEKKKKAANSGKVREELRNRYLVLMQKQLESRFGGGGTSTGAAAGAKRSSYGSFEHFCAALVQSYWRAKVRDHVNIVKRVMFLRKHVIYQVAAHEVQFHFRAYNRWRVEQERKEQRQASETANVETDLRDNAARKLQKAWRGCNDYKMYVALKEIIAFRPRGDPYLLLRSIAPHEAQLLEPATRSHLRFRLGGTSFPPSIYFKIFTHGAVVDIGAFAPRNYVAERSYGVEFPSERYTRTENNGWRPLAVRLYRRVDEVEKLTAKRRLPHFHHNRQVRRADLERRRREKKSAWIRKLYELNLPELTPRTDTGIALPIGIQTAPVSARSAQEALATSRSMPPTADGGTEALQQVRLASNVEARLAQHREAGGRHDPEMRHFRTVHTTPDPTRGSPGMELEEGGELFDDSQPPPRASGLSPGGDLTEIPEDGIHYPSAYAASRGAYVPNMVYQPSAVPAVEPELDDDSLLQWSEQLDFGAYLNSWQRVATSANSEGELPIGWEFVHEV